MLNKTEILQLIDEAILARENAYAKFSNFKVGATLIDDRGNHYSGCNVENSSYGLSMCAERNAIFAGITQGYKPNDFKEIHVLGGNDKNYIITPCGVCRQLIFEMNNNIIVYMYNQNDKIKKTYNFGKSIEHDTSISVDTARMKAATFIMGHEPTLKEIGIITFPSMVKDLTSDILSCLQKID